MGGEKGENGGEGQEVREEVDVEMLEGVGVGWERGEEGQERGGVGERVGVGEVHFCGEEEERAVAGLGGCFGQHRGLGFGRGTVIED